MKSLKNFFLTGSLVLTIIVLIVAFQNIQASCNFVTFFFYAVDLTLSPTIMIFVIALLGIMTGVFYMGYLMSMFSTSEDEDDEDF